MRAVNTILFSEITRRPTDTSQNRTYRRNAAAPRLFFDRSIRVENRNYIVRFEIEIADSLTLSHGVRVRAEIEFNTLVT